MLLVRWLPKARANLTTIIDYIAERNDVAASKLQNDIERATSQLSQHPYLYRLDDSLAPERSLCTTTT